MFSNHFLLVGFFNCSHLGYIHTADSSGPNLTFPPCVTQIWLFNSSVNSTNHQIFSNHKCGSKSEVLKCDLSPNGRGTCIGIQWLLSHMMRGSQKQRSWSEVALVIPNSLWCNCFTESIRVTIPPPLASTLALYIRNVRSPAATAPQTEHVCGLFVPVYACTQSAVCDAMLFFTSRPWPVHAGVKL